MFRGYTDEKAEQGRGKEKNTKKIVFHLRDGHKEVA